MSETIKPAEVSAFVARLLRVTPGSRNWDIILDDIDQRRAENAVIDALKLLLAALEADVAKWRR